MSRCSSGERSRNTTKELVRLALIIPRIRIPTRIAHYEQITASGEPAEFQGKEIDDVTLVVYVLRRDEI